MTLRTTYTYVLLEVSHATFEEVRAKLEAAGYQHAFDTADGRPTIDMQGIALQHPADCVHGEPLYFNCNACSDAAAAGRAINPRAGK